MGENTAIEWAHHTFNPWWGCARVSPACERCYAETFAERFPRTRGLWGARAPRKVASEKVWNDPIRWNREAEAAGERRRVFCASMADVFEDRRDLDDARDRLFDLIHATPGLDWLLLTKRPERVRLLVPQSWLLGFPENVWIGTTVEDQARADERIPHLLELPAKVRFLSCEPLLGAVDLDLVANPSVSTTTWDDHERGISWVIVGGESGRGARPMHPSWATSLRDQCREAGVPFFFKQWGEWQAGSAVGHESKVMLNDGRVVELHTAEIQRAIGPSGTTGPRGFDAATIACVGKKAAGRTLEGRTWDEFPTARVS